jgi:polyvinyl alcohol dehydrogenase (cytochrome)
LVWNVRFGPGTALGGVHWGITTDGERLYVPISDPIARGAINPGVFAVDLKTGKEVWGYNAKPNCDGERGNLVTNCSSKYGFSVAPITVDGAVITGTLGGEVFIHDGESGELINRIDTVGPVATLNDIEGKGGSIDSHGISVGAGLILINSGYASFGQTDGNVLIAYKSK